MAESIEERYASLYQGRDFAGEGKLKCLVCRRPYLEHRITECCLPDRRGAFTTKEKGDRWTPKEEKVIRYKGIPQVRIPTRKEP